MTFSSKGQVYYPYITQEYIQLQPPFNLAHAVITTDNHVPQARVKHLSSHLRRAQVIGCALAE